MSPWLFDILMDECKKEMKIKVGNVGTRLKRNGMGWAVMACLFADDTVMNEFYCICMRRTLKVNASRSKEMVFERREAEVVDFTTPYGVSVPTLGL